jgi:anti-sigma regulatory factor (Ser/Thr protein kinase)
VTRVRADPGAAREARTWLADVLDGGVPEETLQDLRLVVSELVANSVMHAGIAPDATIRLSVELIPGKVVLSVLDDGPGFEPPPFPSQPVGDQGRRGLDAVRILSSRFVVDADHGEVTVEVARD